MAFFELFEPRISLYDFMSVLNPPISPSPHPYTRLSPLSPFSQLTLPQSSSTDLSNSLLAAGIIFLVVIQRRVHFDALGKFCFEAMKALFATAMWLWLLLDALFAHTEDGPYYEEQRRRRIIRAGIASILLWCVVLLQFPPWLKRGTGVDVVSRILFYPPLAYLGWVWMKSRVQARDEEGEEEDGDIDSHFEEDMPLLGERSWCNS
jgi:hypothetical protein